MHRHKTNIIYLLYLVLWLVPVIVQAQFRQYNHPELKWKTIETEHFSIHFHQGSERTARTIAGISESVYKPITDLYGYEPDTKVHWIIRDHDDYANGATYYYDNKIVIWATPLDFELRGTHHWLYDVITHEFTHMIQLGAARKAPRWMPGVYFQYIDYEPEKRPDVLYGYPNRIMSWPTIGTVMPMWFAEGTAQYMVKGLGYDWWDAHRDMILRSRALDGKLLSWNQMGVFGKSSYGSESVYNHGYALVRYISDKWGQHKLSELTDYMSKPFSITFNQACRKVLHLSGKELYANWANEITTEYHKNTTTIRGNIRSGEVICDEGFANLYPMFSPDGGQIAFMSNKGKDYMSLSKLYLYDVEKDSLIENKVPAKGYVSWSPPEQKWMFDRKKLVPQVMDSGGQLRIPRRVVDPSTGGKYLAYASINKPNRDGSHFEDLYLWDFENEEAIRLTTDARLAMPSYSPDGKQLVAIYNSDGTHNLAIVDLPDSLTKSKGDGFDPFSFLKRESESLDLKARLLTEFNNGQQVFRPIFSPDGKYIYCSTGNLGPRDIYRFELKSETWEPFIATKADERDPVFSSDGKTLYWSDDRTGIFNIYRRDLTSGEEEAVTNVLGGAFMPSLSLDDKLAYSEFTSAGYSVRIMEDVVPVEEALTEYLPFEQRDYFELTPPPMVDSEAVQYPSPFNKLSVLPRVAWDYGKFKPGAYFYTNDMLEKMNLFGAASMNFAGERDLYAMLEYRILKPTMYIEAFNIGRFNDQTFADSFVIVDVRYEPSPDGDSLAVPIYDTYSIDYRFNLTEFNIGARIPVSDDLIGTAIFRRSTYKSAMHFDDGGSFDYTYFIGQGFLLRLNGDLRTPSVGSDIQPKGGYRGWIEYAYENNQFIEGFEVEAEKGTIQEVFERYKYHRIETDIDYHHELSKGLTLNPRFIGGWISDNSADSFFHLYGGGLIGMRGYSFYSLGGTKKAVGRLTLRFPILSEIDKRVGPFYFDRVHGGLFAEAGDAWVGDIDFGNLKRDVGAELRLKLFSWYGFPTDIQLTGAYGLDRFTVTDDITNTAHSYGKEWRWYVTVLFDFI